MANNINETCCMIDIMNDDDPSIPVVVNAAPVMPLGSRHHPSCFEANVRIYEVEAESSMDLYDTTSTSEDNEEDNYDMTSETKSSINIAGSSSESLLSSSFSSSHSNNYVNKNSHGYCSWLCYRPPFHVTAMYLWTQFNISYMLRKFSFLFDTHHNNENHDDYHYMDENLQQHHYFHLATIHYVEMGIIDIVIMNLILMLFLSTSYVYRSRQGKVLHQNAPPTTTTTASQRSFQRRYRSNKSYLLELVTIVTFLLLILRLRGAAINVILISTIYMFLHLISRLYQSTLPPLLLFPYKL